MKEAFIKHICISKLAICLLALMTLVSCKEAEDKKYNVLMICVDDLRPALGCYGDEVAKSPNIDEFASNACLFNNHYVQSAVCGPSRSMLLTGKITRSWDAWSQLRNLENEPDEPVSLPHLFKKNGYKTVCIGKVSHEPGGVMDKDQTIPQIPFSWDTTYTKVGKWSTPWRAFFAYANGDSHNKFRGKQFPEYNKPHLPYECGDVDDVGYPDGLNAREAMKQVKRLGDENMPFFLAVGFYKPHLPFNAPKKYCQLYEKEEIPRAPNNYPPKNTNEKYALHNSFEVTTHYHWPDGEGNINADKARELKHHYLACVSYIDRQIGLILDELKRQKLDQNTIVLLWGDHGWHLEEHGIFGKHTNFNIATRSPLIVKVPGITEGGKRTNGIVETIDIYPTLAALCELEAPSDLQGSSFVELIKQPETTGKPYARSFFSRHQAMGKTIKTDRYRVVQWKEKDSTVAVELYDHRHDPNENINIARKDPVLTDSLLTILHEPVFF